MQHLEHLWKAVNIVGSVRDLAVESKSYQWDISPPITFYLHVEHADVTITRHPKPQISAKVELHAGFGWQVATDQDEAGVYMVAKRKPLIGTIGRGKFDLQLPHDIHVSLKLEHCQLTLNNLHTTLDIPPYFPLELPLE